MADSKGPPPDIEAIFREHVLVERALEEAARQAIAEHEAEGLPLAIWRDGRVQWVKAEELPE